MAAIIFERSANYHHKFAYKLVLHNRVKISLSSKYVIGMAGEIRGHSKKARFCFAAFDSKIEKDSLRERFSIANYVVDAIMGAGKTTAAVNKINTSRGPFIYVTPYLNEVKRIIKACPRQKFKEPRAYGSKLKDFKELLKKGTNIATTHALFGNFDLEVVEILHTMRDLSYTDYTLIIDEVPDVIRPTLMEGDYKYIFEELKVVEVDPQTRLVKWIDKAYMGKYQDYKRQCDMGCMAMFDDCVFWLFPVKVFEAFQNTYILTYMFDAQIQKYYYDFHGIKYEKRSVQNGVFVPYSSDISNRIELLGKIDILDKDKLNGIGEQVTSLSKGWYSRSSKDGESLEQLQKNIYNFFRHYTKTNSEFNLWTTFKEWKGKLSGNGYAKGFAPQNVRATNEYRHKISVAYPVNRYMNPIIKNFFVRQGVEVDEEAFALSEMLQFIWRSGIRDGKDISLYVPSSRMRVLLVDWIDSINK